MKDKLTWKVIKKDIHVSNFHKNTEKPESPY